MTKGERICYAIDKEVCRFSLVEWCEEWGIDKDDYEKFMEAGAKALPEEEEGH